MTSFIKKIITLYGNEGQAWLDRLPHVIQELAEQWELGALIAAENPSYNAVYFSTLKPLVLKVGFDREGIAKEARALQAFCGRGCVPVHKVDLDKGALLIGRVIPGVSLKTFFPHNDLMAVEKVVKVMRCLYKAPSYPKDATFPTLRDWLRGLDSAQDIPQSLLQEARVLAENLLQTSGDPVLLHGDLHHENVLSSGEEWVAIDPKGVWGEPAFEVGVFIRNPTPDLLKSDHAHEIITKRIELFASLLTLEKTRIRQWSFVEAVLSACWSVEDNEDPTYFLNLAEMLKD